MSRVHHGRLILEVFGEERRLTREHVKEALRAHVELLERTLESGEQVVRDSGTQVTQHGTKLTWEYCGAPEELSA